MPGAIETHHLTIQRRLRYATLGAAAEAASEIWFVLHGYGQLAPRFLRRFRTLDDGTRRLVAPEGLHRHYVDHEARKVGASWMTSEDRLTDIDDYVAYLDRLYETEVPEARREAVAVVGLGFSQGVHTLCRWLAFGTSRIDAAVLWGAGVPPDLDLEAAGESLRRVRLFLAAGDGDEHFGPEVAAAVRARLEAHAVPVAILGYAGGHRLDADLLRRIAVLAASGFRGSPVTRRPPAPRRGPR